MSFVSVALNIPNAMFCSHMRGNESNWGNAEISSSRQTYHFTVNAYTSEMLNICYDAVNTIGVTRGRGTDSPGWPTCDFRYKWSFATNLSSCQETRWVGLWYGIRILAVDHFVLFQYTHLTDGRTDKQTERRQEDGTLHSQSHGKTPLVSLDSADALCYVPCRLWQRRWWVDRYVLSTATSRTAGRDFCRTTPPAQLHTQ